MTVSEYIKGHSVTYNPRTGEETIHLMVTLENTTTTKHAQAEAREPRWFIGDWFAMSKEWPPAKAAMNFYNSKLVEGSKTIIGYMTRKLYEKNILSHPRSQCQIGESASRWRGKSPKNHEGM